MARIAVGGFMHETNCFVPDPTAFTDFATFSDRPPLCRGDEVLSELRESKASMSGFMAAAGARHDLAPLVWASATAGGTVTEDGYERIAGELLAALAAALPVDGVYLELHGAMVAAHLEDGEGELLRRVREIVGDRVPIVASLDYHANVTPAMVRHADGLVAFRTYPHLDRKETGERSVQVLERLLRHGRPAGRALWHAPFLLPLEFQCTMVAPSKDIVEAVTDSGARDGIDCLSYLAGFPPADLFHCGPTLACHARDQTLAEATVDDLLGRIVSREADFAEPLLSPDEAVARALARSRKGGGPVIIADTQDNPGCGGSGDTTEMLAALVRNDAWGAVFGVVRDADAALAAHGAGMGARLTLDLGGGTDLPGVEPYGAAFTVKRLMDGKFAMTGPCGRGQSVDLSPMALLSVEGIDVIVSGKRVQALDQSIFRHAGIEPGEQSIIVLKSTCHFRADFQPIASEVLVAVAPGGYVSDPTRYPYEKLRPGVRLSPLGPEHAPRQG